MTLKLLKLSNSVYLRVRVILTIIRFIPQPHYAITLSHGSTLWCLFWHEAIHYVQGTKRLPLFFFSAKARVQFLAIRVGFMLDTVTLRHVLWFTLSLLFS